MKYLKDLFYLEMAYGLAEKAWGWASPNPYVGAVIVKKDIIIGHGYHERPGKPHAEVVALERAGTQVKGSTAYITLEPCVHWGRTPPCVDRLLEARPRRVIVSALDPNPLVFKKGIKKLKDSGIEVSVGLLEEKNRRLNETYIKYITQKIPFVTAKAALTLDGRIATRTFDSKWISSSQTREYVHLLRGEYDAIMVGIGTLARDDPLLTVRHPNWKGKKIIRVILDSRLRFPLGAKILSTLAEGKILVFTLNDAPQRKADALIKKGVEVIPLSGSSTGIDLHEVFSWLGKQEIASLLVEGGRHLLTSLLEARLADKIFLTLSPRLIGGEKALAFIGGKGVSLVKDSLNLKHVRYFQIENDMTVEGYF